MAIPIRKTDSPILFIQKAVASALDSVYTSTMATITTVGLNTVSVTIDTSKIELDDIPIITLQGGGSFLQFPIAVGDQCMLIFSRDSADNWQGGGTDLVYSTSFDINNAFALVGINNNLNLIDIQTYTNLAVDKMKIQNSTAELITTLSNTLQQVIDAMAAVQLLTVTTVAIGQPTSVPRNSSDFSTIQTDLETLKGEIDSFKA